MLSMGQVNTIRAHELSPDLIARWAEIVRTDRAYQSPFFRPEFVQAVAQVRDDVEVAIIEAEGRPMGFFPFQRGRGDVALPVGGFASDFHGVILAPEFEIEPRQLLQGCRLRAWHFSHLIQRGSAIEDQVWSWVQSPLIDISLGFEHFAAIKRANGSDLLKKNRRKARRLAEAWGPLRFEMSDPDPRVYDKLVEWKSRQCRANGLFDLFSCGWTGDLFKLLLARRDEVLRGMMGALYAGDRLVSIHFGMQSHRVLHAWVPSYNHDLHQYSPGIQLWIRVLQSASDWKIEHVDFGKGDERFKRQLSTGHTLAGEGSIDTRATVRVVRRTWHRVHHRVRNSSLRGPLTPPWRLVKRAIRKCYFG